MTQAVTTVVDQPFIGLTMRLVDAGSVYNKFRAAFWDRCVEIGINRFRLSAPAPDSPGKTTIWYMAARGAKFLFTIPAKGGFASTFAFARALETLYPGSVIGFEGPNEVNGAPVSFGGVADPKGQIPKGESTLVARAAVRDLMSATRNAMLADPLFAGMHLYGYTDYDIALDMDCITVRNTHAYFDAPATWFNKMRPKNMPGSKPIGLTEVGPTITAKKDGKLVMVATTPEKHRVAMKAWAKLLLDPTLGATSFAFQGLNSGKGSVDDANGLLTIDGDRVLLTPAAAELKSAIAKARKG